MPRNDNGKKGRRPLVVSKFKGYEDQPAPLGLHAKKHYSGTKKLRKKSH